MKAHMQLYVGTRYNAFYLAGFRAEI